VRHQVRHKDGNGLNPRASNLAWATPKENAADKRRHGTLRRGADCHNAILTPEIVRQIRIQVERCKTKTSRLAALFGVRPECIRKVIRRETWAWVK
jgi:hypothetical protein